MEKLTDRILKIKNAIAPLKEQLSTHKIYTAIHELADLQIFMQYHVFAVWDFMSLLKALQNNLTCTNVPWLPKGNGESAYLINEIVLAEETDLDIYGNRKSHFEIYLDAMEQCGANSKIIEHFLRDLKETGDIDITFQKLLIPKEVKNFINVTLDVAKSEKGHVQAAVFAFGREDLIFNLFVPLLKNIESKFPDRVSIFKYYVSRHIEVDGDHHSKLALKMVSILCGDNEMLWNEAEMSAIKALEARLQLWDAVHQEIMLSRNNKSLSIGGNKNLEN